MKLFKRLKIIALAAIILVVIIFFGINYYVNSHKQEIFKELENWYTKNYHGTLSVGNVSVNVFEHFPNASLIVKDITVTDSLYSKHKFEALKIGELSLVVSLSDLRNDKLHFQKAQLKNGSLHLVTDSTGYSNATIFKQKPKDSTKTATSDLQFIIKQGKLNIKNFNVLIENHAKNKRFKLLANAIKSDITLNKENISATADVDINVNQLGFNLENGTFLNQTRLRGILKPTFKKDSGTIEIPKFDLKIDDQNFTTKADINIKNNTFSFKINNPKTDFEKTRNLISENIKSKLEKINFSQPISVNAKLDGSFTHKSIPLVNIDFSTQNNSFSIGDSILIKNTTLNGKFINKYYKETIESKEHKKNFRVYVNTLNGNFKGVNFKIKNSQLAATNKIKSYINLKLKANGKNTELNNILKNKNFLFREGNFKFSTSFKGNYKNTNQLLSNLHSKLSIDKSTIFYTPLKLLIPVDSIHVDIIKKNAILHNLSLPIKDTKNKLSLAGEVENLTSLIFKKNEKVTSTIKINSSKLVWKDFTALFGNLKSDKSKNKKKRNVFNKALKEIYKKFEPTIHVEIDEFNYDGFNAKQFKTGLEYKNINELILKETSFRYKDGNVVLYADFDITSDNLSKFKIKFNAKSIKLGDFLEDFDYFNLRALQRTEKIAGNLNVNANLNGTIYDRNGLDDKSLDGTINFDIKKLELDNFEPFVKVGNIAFKKNRVENVRFAPIKNKLRIKNRTIEIPRMQVQSTAFDLFVQGQLGYDKNTNIWLSIPLKNLKKRDIDIVPKKISYNESGKKVFIEVKEDITGKLKYKLHLNNKKLYEEQGILDEYKYDHKEERIERRHHNKEVRKEKRENRKENRVDKKQARKKRKQNRKKTKQRN